MIAVSVTAVAVLADYGIALLLKEEHGTRVLPIFIGPLEATAIDSHLKGEVPSRPLTHDLSLSLINNLHADLICAEIWKVENETFYAKLILSQHQVIEDGTQAARIEIDARPSDAVGIALRGGVPIYVDDQLMNQEGKLFTEENGNIIPVPQNFLESTPEEIPHIEVAQNIESVATDLLAPTIADGTQSDVVSLKIQLSTAIKEENYESAARLRDTISKLENAQKQA